ncbi:hypothetical protein DIPPA_24144 [Diplonema papillatum]|nr:hypothetical protein DIPPA_24144 [Diplonema papillatum]
MGDVAEHVQAVFRYKVASLVLNFKIDRNDTIWLQWCDCIRLVSVDVPEKPHGHHHDKPEAPAPVDSRRTSNACEASQLARTLTRRFEKSDIAEHVQAVFRNKVASLVLNFKIDRNDTIWLQWCHCIRLVSVDVPRRALSVLACLHQPEKPHDHHHDKPEAPAPVDSRRTSNACEASQLARTLTRRFEKSDIAEHVQAVFRYKVASLVLNFKIDRNDTIWLQWCDCIRLVSVDVPRRALSVLAACPHQPEKPGGGGGGAAAPAKAKPHGHHHDKPEAPAPVDSRRTSNACEASQLARTLTKRFEKSCLGARCAEGPPTRGWAEDRRPSESGLLITHTPRLSDAAAFDGAADEEDPPSPDVDACHQHQHEEQAPDLFAGGGDGKPERVASVDLGSVDEPEKERLCSLCLREVPEAGRCAVAFKTVLAALNAYDDPAEPIPPPLLLLLPRLTPAGYRGLLRDPSFPNRKFAVCAGCLQCLIHCASAAAPSANPTLPPPLPRRGKPHGPVENGDGGRRKQDRMKRHPKRGTAGAAGTGDPFGGGAKAGKLPPLARVSSAAALDFYHYDERGQARRIGFAAAAAPAPSGSARDDRFDTLPYSLREQDVVVKLQAQPSYQSPREACETPTPAAPPPPTPY